MKLRVFFAVFSLVLASFSAMAEDFISTETPSRLFNFGIRAGVNTSNSTFPAGYFDTWNKNSWGTGLQAGVVLNLNMREFFAVQPGFFVESRSGDFSYVQSYVNSKKENDNFIQMGHIKNYFVTVPVMFSFRFNLSATLKWLLEAGPYAQFRVRSSGMGNIDIITKDFSQGSLEVEHPKSNSVDFGVKLGSGIMFKDHYSFSVHYMAGLTNVWKAPFEGGRNKAWTFTLGYDF